MTTQPAIPERLTLAAFQAYVAEIVVARGFTRDLDRIFILWVEELGELADHLERTRPELGRVDRKLGWELADVALYVADLANGLGVDLGAALRATPPWPAPGGEGTVRDWQGAAPALLEDTAARTVAGLIGAAGELARLLRKRWSRREDLAPAAPLAAAFGHVLALASFHGIDLTRAIAEKEQKNATRTWTY